MSLLGLGGYGSGSGSDSEDEEATIGPQGPEEEDGPAEEPSEAPAEGPAPNYCYAATSSDDDSEDEEAPEERGAPAATTASKPLEATSAPAPGLLPDPLAALDGAAKPAFLTPSATKPLAVVRRAKPPPKAWEEKPPDEARAMVAEHVRSAAVAGATISASAVKYKNQESSDPLAQQLPIDPLALAMLGDQVGSKAAGAAVQGAQPGEPRKRSVLLGSGEKGEVKEREKKKRMMGQNGRDSVTWKSEEEMILRQQFDS